MCNGAGLDVSAVGRVSGMCVAGRLFGLMFAGEAFIQLAYEFGLCEGKLSDVMNSIHEEQIVVSMGVVSLGNFLCSVVAGTSSVALGCLERFRGWFGGLFCLHSVV